MSAVNSIKIPEKRKFSVKWETTPREVGQGADTGCAAWRRGVRGRADMGKEVIKEWKEPAFRNKATHRGQSDLQAELIERGSADTYCDEFSKENS